MTEKTRLLIALPAVLTLALASAAAAEPAVPVFANETAASGLTTIYDGEYFFMVGGGPAVFDCSGDRLPEVFLPGGSGKAQLYLNQSKPGQALSFAATESGLEIDNVLGAYPLDIDSDGITDLAILRQGENQVMRGLGNCRFEAANQAWGFDGGKAWSASYAAIWEKGATWPTIAIGNYIDPTQEAFPWGSCTENWLHRPAEGMAGFAPPLPLKPSFCALSMLFTDWNRTGHASLRVSNDREYYKGGQEQMWHIEPGQPPRLYTPDEGWKRLRIWGMGIASADITLDGYPDYFLTSMADNKLQVLKDAPADGAPLPVYADIALKRGVTAHRPYTGDDLRPSTAWHAEFEDVNSDGRLDIFVVKGNVARMPDFAEKDPNNLLLQREDGTFLEAGEMAGVASMGVGRGGAVVDLNADGKLDILVTNRWSTAEVWRQTGETGNWVEIALHQPQSNRDAIGAVVELRRGDKVERHEITSGGGHAGGQLGWLHFGLGTATTAEMRVIWPDGSEGEWQSLPAGGFYDLSPGQPPAVWTPPAP